MLSYKYPNPVMFRIIPTQRPPLSPDRLTRNYTSAPLTTSAFCVCTLTLLPHSQVCVPSFSFSFFIRPTPLVGIPTSHSVGLSVSLPRSPVLFSLHPALPSYSSLIPSSSLPPQNYNTASLRLLVFSPSLGRPLPLPLGLFHCSMAL